MDTFSIDASKGGTVSTARGTKIIVPTNAFKSSSGYDVKGNVRIEIKEFVNKSDVVLSEFSSSQFINKYNDSIVEMP